MSTSHIVDFLLEDEGSWDFVSDLTNIDVTGAQENWSSSSATATVSWHLDMDVRKWGVKEFNPVLKEIDVRIVFDDYTYEKESEHDVQIRFNAAQQSERPATEDPKSLAQFYETYTAEAKWEPYQSSNFVSVRPTSMEIDMARRHIVVYFG